ncbi:MAG: hypothetical protein HN494_14390 [Opitutae bacterium]|nr:hypothetical protein [Opitutae bacterium]
MVHGRCDECLDPGRIGNLIIRYTTLLNAHGNPIKHYGDLDLEMSRKKFDQLGSIKQFMG